MTAAHHNGEGVRRGLSRTALSCEMGTDRCVSMTSAPRGACARNMTAPCPPRARATRSGKELDISTQDISGGVRCSPHQRQVLEKNSVVLLRGDSALARGQVQRGTRRMAGSTTQPWSKSAAERRPRYHRLMDILLSEVHRPPLNHHKEVSFHVTSAASARC